MVAFWLGDTLLMGESLGNSPTFALCIRVLVDGNLYDVPRDNVTEV